MSLKLISYGNQHLLKKFERFKLRSGLTSKILCKDQERLVPPPVTYTGGGGKRRNAETWLEAEREQR